MNREQFAAEFGQQVAINLPGGVFSSLNAEEQQLALSGGIDFVGHIAREGIDLAATPVLCFPTGHGLEPTTEGSQVSGLLLFLQLLERVGLVAALTQIEDCTFVHPKESLSRYVGDVSAALLLALPVDALHGFDDSPDIWFDAGHESVAFTADLSDRLHDLGHDEDTDLWGWTEHLLDAMTLKLFGKTGADQRLHFRHPGGNLADCVTSTGHAVACSGQATWFRPLLIDLLDAGLIGELTLDEDEYVIGRYENLYVLALRSLSMHTLIATEPVDDSDESVD